MDPVNLSGIQNAPSDCKSYAGIRSPAGCACCGLKDYPQNIPQAYCFTALCPGLSKCKPPQDHQQDSFAIPHPIFSTFPFQQHFFHSTIMPPNFCCTQKLSSDIGTNPSQIQLKSEHKINPHQADINHLPQKDKSDFADTVRSINEDTQKSIPETSLPYAYQTEPQPNVFQRCVCGDSIPWACSPFIVPVFSYCLLWNSQAASTLLSKTYNSYLAETLCQKNCKKQETQKYSCATECEEQTQVFTEEPVITSVVVTKCDKNTDSTEISKVYELSKTELKMEDQEESMEQAESECTKNESEMNFEEEEILEDIDEFELGEDSEIRDQTESVESQESLKVDENESPVPDSRENLQKDLEDSASHDMTSPATTSSATESSTNLKTPPESSEHSLNDTLSANSSNIWPTEAAQEVQEGQSKEVIPPTVPKEEPEEKNSEPEESDTSKTNLKEVVIKKCIKNFTVTDEINGALGQEVQMSAAGDLGGECCESCKILTSAEENIEEVSKEPTTPKTGTGTGIGKELPKEPTTPKTVLSMTAANKVVVTSTSMYNLTTRCYNQINVANEESEAKVPKVSDEGDIKCIEVRLIDLVDGIHLIDSVDRVPFIDPVVQRVSDEIDERLIEDIQSSGQKFKSGIAKLSNSTNLKSPKSSSGKTTKKCKNSTNEKQSNAARVKHCCFPGENTSSKCETPPKVQKTKKSALAQNPSPVSGRETPKKSTTRQTLKTPRKPARPANQSENSSKAVKTLVKK